MKTEQKIKAVIYARVSSKEQEDAGYSLPAQEKYLQEYAKRPETDFEVVKLFQVSESAGGKIVRTTFNEMLSHIREKDVPVMIVETTDRLTRNFADVPLIDAWIMEDDKHQVHLAKEGCVLHRNSKSHEWFMWRVKVATAEYYVKLLSENVQKGQKEKIAQGWLPTTPPLGYKTIGEKGHKIHVVDDAVAPYIKKMYEMYASGNFSTALIGKKMYELGFRSRSGGRVVKSKIHKLLGEVFYTGKFLWKGKLYQGKHVPIIPVDLYEQVQHKMQRGLTPYYNKHPRELQGKISCGNCSKTVTWEKQKGQLYGACKHCKAQLAKERKYIRYEDVEDALLARIASIAPQSERIQQILHLALKESHSEEIALQEVQEKSIRGSLERIRQRKSTMYLDRLDGRISVPLYDANIAEFTKEEEILIENLKKLKSDQTEYYKTGISIHELALKGREIYKSKNATLEERRMLLAYAFNNVTLLRGVETPEYTPAFVFMMEWMPKVNKSLEPAKNIEESVISSGSLTTLGLAMLKIRDAPINEIRTAKNGSVTEPFDASYPELTTLLPGQDSNLRPID